MTMFSTNKIPLLTLALMLSVSLLLMLSANFAVKSPAPPNELAGVLRPYYKPIQPVELVDHSNIPFGNQNFIGKWTIVFFGYLSCPDICPTTLHVLNSVQQHLKKTGGNAGADFQTVFVSVDPARDDASRIGKYIHFFNSDFIGVTGSRNEIDDLTQQFGAGYVIGEKDSSGQYDVAHTSAVFLVDPQSRLVASFSQPHHAETISAQFTKIVNHIDNGDTDEEAMSAKILPHSSLNRDQLLSSLDSLFH